MNGFFGTSDFPPLVDGETVTVRLTYVPPPPAPADLVASHGDGEVALSWAAPGSGVTRHEYRYRTTGSYPDEWTEIDDSGAGGANASGFTVTRLDNGTAYTFEVRAVASGAGAASEAGPVTPAPPPVAFTSCMPNPGDVWCGAVTVGRVATTKGRTLKRGFHATWHAGQNSDGVGELPDRRFVYGPNSYRIDEVTVGAGNMAGFLFLSLDRPLPAAVRARLVLHVGGKRFLPSEAHHAGRTDTYHWRGTGLDWSSTSSVTLRLRADLPAAPTGLRAEAPTDTGGLLKLSWTAPASGVPITGYEVKYWEAAVDEDRRFGTRLTGSADTSMLLYPYLDANTEYKLRVRARNAIGGGEWSAAATARTGAQQQSKPIMSLQVVDGSGNDIDTVTAGGTFRYRIKLANIRNHHLTFDGVIDPDSAYYSEHHGWGTLGIRGAWAMDFVLGGDPEGSKLTCESESLFLRDFVETSATSGYWEFVSPGLPLDAGERGPLRLRLGFKCTGRHNGASTEIDTDDDGVFDIVEESPPSDGVVDTTSEALLRLGRPNRACLSVANDLGMVTNACGSGEAGARALTAQFESAPAQHDGRKRIKVRVAFSEAPENVDADGVRVEGGRVTSSKRVGGSPQGDAQGRSDARSAPRTAGGAAEREVVWEFEIEPSSGEDVTVALEAGRPCEEEGAICTADGRSLSEGITTTVEGPETGPSALTARFEGLPETHDGSRAIRFRVAFSENIGISYRSLREDAFTVSGGRVTGGKRVDGRRDLFEMTVRPETDGDVSVALPAERSCGVSGPRESGAICTKSRPRRRLTNAPAATVPGPASASAPAPLTASFEGVPEGHDGQSLFRFRVAFSEDIGIGLRSLREGAFTVSGGRVTGGRRVDGRRDLFEMTVRPDSVGEVSIALAAGRACAVSGAICTRSQPRRQLTNAPAATVSGPAGEPLTAAFEGMPAEHDGESPFKFRIAFSDGIRFQGWMWRFYGVAVTGGRVEEPGRPVGDRKDLWELTVQPRTYGDIVLTLAPGAACGKPGAVCTRDGRALSNTVTATVAGPVAVSVADARAREGTDETIDFAVSLSRASSGPVAVAYATTDGTATAGEDYTRTSGTLSFDPGETGKTVAVPVLDDAVDEGEETFTLRLSDASGGRIADGVATGTIVNSDHLQTVWLSRFGRTVAGQVVEAVTGRLSGPPGGSRVTLGGRGIDLSALSAGTGEARRSLAGAGAPSHLIECGQNPRISPRRVCARSPGAARAANDDEPLAGLGSGEAARSGSWEAARAGSWEAARSGSGSWADPETGHGSARTLTGRELLLGSSFHLAAGGGEAGGPGYAAWGRVAVGGFDAEAPAEKGTVRLDGEVTTGILGADAEWERWLAGVALSVSSAEGTFDQPDVDSGTVESSLGSINPYVRYEASDRLSVWGLLGYGTGDMTMTQAANDNRREIVTRTDLMMRLGAAGARGVLLEADETGGIDLALRGDAFLVQMESEAAANTVETKADASRLRLVLEAGRSFALGEGAVLAPALELGLRHDGGDAETGTGVEVGGRIRYTDAGSGLTVEANARTLVAHEDSGYREWGAGGSVRLGPDASGRGLSLALAPVWGTPSSGVDRLWSARDAAGLAPGGEFEAERRLEGEVGYGFGAFGGRGVVTPYAGFGLAEAGDRTWRAGARWSLAPHLAMSLDGTRREPANDDAPEHGVQFRFTLHW